MRPKSAKQNVIEEETDFASRAKMVDQLQVNELELAEKTLPLSAFVGRYTNKCQQYRQGTILISQIQT